MQYSGLSLSRCDTDALVCGGFGHYIIHFGAISCQCRLSETGVGFFSMEGLQMESVLFTENDMLTSGLVCCEGRCTAISKNPQSGNLLTD